MSYVKHGRNQINTKTKGQNRAKRTTTTKKEWVSTVNDLSVHQLTPDELNHRHEIHQSHNKASAQWELKERALKRRLRHGKSPAPLDCTRLSILREVLSEELLLQDVLARSDKAMAVVKDLFGDSPRRQIAGHASVTAAPDIVLPDHQRALNEFEAPEELSDEETYFDKENRSINLKDHGRMKKHHFNNQKCDMGGYKILKTPHATQRNKIALNATPAVKFLQSKVSQSDDREESSVLVSQVLKSSNQSGHRASSTTSTEQHESKVAELEASSVASLSSDQSTLGLLQTMLGQVEAELGTLTPSGEAASALNPKAHQSQSLTGFSVALVSTMGCLVQHLKQIKLQSEEKACGEAAARKQLEAEVSEQRGLIDALTAETMTLREEAATLQEELRACAEEMEHKLDTLVLAIGDQLKMDSNPNELLLKEPVVSRSALNAEQMRNFPASPPVMLSQSQQVNDWLQARESHPVHHHTYSHKPVKASRPTRSPSVSSFPSSSSPSATSATVRSQSALDAMMEEITQLGQQNEQLKAQLHQARGDGAKMEGSTEVSGARRHLSGSSTQGISSLCVRETRRQKPQPQPAEQPADQVDSNCLSANIVQQRLLELNKQSAIARNRLLELIEQQRQSVSDVSLSGSTTSSFTPSTRGEKVTSVMFQHEHLSKNTLPACSEVSPQAFKAETRKSNAKVDYRREPDGWFSLSGHLR